MDLPGGRERYFLGVPDHRGDADAAPPTTAGRARAPLTALVALALVAGAVAGASSLAARDSGPAVVAERRGWVTMAMVGRDRALGGPVDPVQLTNTAFAVGAPCQGSDVAERYADVVPGSRARVQDGSGATIATGWLSKGVWVRRACRMPLVVRDLPDAEEYLIGVGRRPAQRYDSHQLKADGFELELTS